MYLIAGLGNPGRQYALTRHNIGFEVIDYLVDELKLGSKKIKFNGEYYTHTISGEKIIFLKPLTYMNFSGECVKAYVDYFDIETDKIMIIYDDTSFDTAAVRVKKSGSSAGHKGMEDIILNLNSEDIPRIRIGIGQAEYDIKNHVLSRFSEQEIPLMQQAVKTAAKAVLLFIEKDVNTAMNLINKKTKSKDTNKPNENE
ncbi:MAG: aminoacyl-tRNA hydrolase [Eubacteriaceae bacterium]|nr:aminoacyl-tRNA hydrolase [Eubacteriaceae bacterium]